MYLHQHALDRRVAHLKQHLLVLPVLGEERFDVSVLQLRAQVHHLLLDLTHTRFVPHSIAQPRGQV